MFRTRNKKRSRATRIRVDADDDDDDDEAESGTSVMIDPKRKLTKKANRITSRPFDRQTKGDKGGDSSNSCRTQVRTNKGCGLPQQERDGERDRHKDVWASYESEPGDFCAHDASVPATIVSSYGYSKEALSQLKSEQRYQTKVAQDSEMTRREELPPAGSDGCVPATLSDEAGPPEEQRRNDESMPSYLPLPPKSVLGNSKGMTTTTATTSSAPVTREEEPAILTGEEAFLFGQVEMNSQPSPSSREPVSGVAAADDADPRYSNHAAEESSAWEAQVTRRAGLTSEEANAQRMPTIGPPPSSASPSPPIGSQLRSKFASTLVQLDEQQQDLERACQRRQAEVEQTESELRRHRAELAQSGGALEFYQQLRVQLVAWVGALRELAGKVLPIQDALHELESQVAANDRWRDWEDDFVAVLARHGMLDRVLGRQPPAEILSPAPEMRAGDAAVDEFGRDVKSQHVLRREKRLCHRRRIQQQRGSRAPPRGDESDAHLSDGEQEDFRERHVALQGALDVALDDLDEHYKFLGNLVSVFERWQQAYGEDYDQCFASLSLGDLASVMVQVELCALNDPWNESEGYREAKWTTVIHHAIATPVLDQAGVERMIEKGIVPAVQDILRRAGYNLVSSRQARSLSAFFRHVQKIIAPDSLVLSKLRNRLVSYIKAQLDDLALPIVCQNALIFKDKSTGGDLEDLAEALRAATVGQVHRIKKILLNLLTHWKVVLGEDDNFIDLVLDFVSSKFLFLLSSIQGLPPGLGLPQSSSSPCSTGSHFEEAPAVVFGSVYRALQSTGWMERPEMLVQVATLRAAAAAYQI